MKKTLGGDRLGSGSKLEVDLHNYSRSTHNLSYLWRSTMAAGTLVPFICEVALPGDTFDIDLDVDVKTHPTIGPLFGSYKIQADTFLCPIRLYQGQLHNNKLGIGLNMANIKLPQITLTGTGIDAETVPDLDNSQINPSCILKYFGISGVGIIEPSALAPTRDFNGIPLLAYWDIYKNYYSNKQEEKGAVIHTEPEAIIASVADPIVVNNGILDQDVPEYPNTAGIVAWVNDDDTVTIGYTGGTPPKLYQIMINTDNNGWQPLSNLIQNIVDNGTDTLTATYRGELGTDQWINWRYILPTEITETEPGIVIFDLNNLDEMREKILTATQVATPFNINTANLEPYSLVLGSGAGRQNMMGTQEGLGLKTYQSDLFNNWLSTEWIDGPGGINEITAIDVSDGTLEIQSLILSRKVYDMLNRIAVSGGSFYDWIDAAWAHEGHRMAETPIYMGGLMRELVFQEVISNSDSPESGQPLGTLAGRGVMAKRQKGGKINIKVDEPSYIIGIISLTPRIDYSQGNKWDVHLKTMDDFHKPGLDEIGFQDLVTEKMAWWDTHQTELGVWTLKSAGKQPAWIDYMTNVNVVRGNFAIETNEMFMTLNRRYEPTEELEIKDLTTYIDPRKFNNIFADTSLDAQNFWTQISVDMIARRKMSAKVMPNL